ncbi:hypothetical protein BGY98DRAFT_1185916 [Russula aff. rugulosa BPL654]|nr:hypothetical protein BGY98DRAFT_1185916 [Russula aff. rugulosa BPL654]
MMNRVSYDVLDRASIDNLFRNPPVIDHQTYYPSVPRYIQPIYGLEVAIVGLKDVLGAMPAIDHYIRSTYGDVIASSRMALNGDAYCVVFKTWSQTSQFLADPFTAFDSGLGVSHSISNVRPALLYVLNSDGLLQSPRPSDPSGGPSRQVQGQFDLLHQKVDSGARAFEILATQQEHLSQQMHDNAQRTAASIAGMSTIMSSSACLQAATSHLEALRSDTRTSKMLLAIAPPAQADAIVQSLRNTEAEISAQFAVVTQAQESLRAAERLLPSLALAGAPPLSAPAPRAALGNRRARALVEDDADMDDTARRLRPRTEHSPSRDDSPILVDSSL